MALTWARRTGPLTILVLVVALCAQWVLQRPSGVPTGTYIGQLVGAESILLLSIALVLISTLPFVEAWFDGIDRAAIWHRRVAIAGVALLIVHILLAESESSSSIGPTLGLIGLLGLLGLVLWAMLPRWRFVVPGPLRPAIVALRDAPGIREVRRVFGGYERWRALHRTVGLFVAAGFVHGLLDGTPFDDAPALRWSYLAIGGIGLAFYLERELLARWITRLHDYVVARVEPLGEGLVEITLRPLGRRIEFVPGQWAMLYLEGKDGWHRHPFTIASAPHEQGVRVTVKALGDATARAHLVEPGMPAVLGGPHGRFDHRRGGRHQVWIAGGVGFTPFLSWMRAAPDHPFPERVDFFHSSRGRPPFADELEALAARHPQLHVHLVDTTRQPRMTADWILDTAQADARDVSVFLCGPTPMLRSLQLQLRRAGVAGRRLHREYFDWR
jgi:predicted ferric reductase